MSASKEEEESEDNVQTLPLSQNSALLNVQETERNNNEADAYGKLLLLEGVQKKAPVIYLQKHEYKFGKGSSAVEVDVKLATYMDCVTNCSTIHFKIIREELAVAGRLVTIIEDTSTNGTYVNNEKLGKGVKQVLLNRDEIGVLTGKPAMFHYMEKRDMSEYPLELMQRYVITETRLGSGAAASVRLVHRKEDSVALAMKTIKVCEYGGEINSRNIVERELKILPRLDHPFIIQTHDIYRAGPKQEIVHIVMELAKEGTLLNYVVNPSGVLPSERAVIAILLQLLRALYYLHAKGISHRDIKPENILLANKDLPQIKLADFGLSNEKKEHATLMVGTSIYMAPEVKSIECPQTYTCAADVWSLGVVLYFCLIGYDPDLQTGIDGVHHSPDELQSLVVSRVNCAREWQNLSGDAQLLIHRMLTVDPKLRITAEQALQCDFLKGVRAEVEGLLSKGNETVSEEEIIEKENRKRHRTGDDDEANCKIMRTIEH